MNIGIFTDCYYPQINGVITSTLTLKKELEKRGHTVTIVTVKMPGVKKEPGVLRIPSIPFRKWKEFRIGIFFPPMTLKKIAKLKLDVIHTQTEFSVCMMARVIAKVLRIPVVHTYHTMYEDYTHYAAKTRVNQKIWKELMKVGSKRYVNECSGIIVPSKKTKEALVRYGVAHKIDVIPTGIELANFQNASAETAETTKEEQLAQKLRLRKLKRSLGIGEQDHVVLTLARVSKEKSIDIIIKQLETLLKTRDNIKYMIVGDGPERENLEKLANKLNLGGKVIFTGRVLWNETRLYYGIADLFITASITETQGLTLYEAMAAGTPLVAKYDQNLDGQIVHGENALVFTKDEELSAAVERALGNPELLEHLIKNGMETVKEISSEKFGEKVEAVYQRVIKEKKQSRMLGVYQTGVKRIKKIPGIRRLGK